jgi:isopenicillin N synthase-like dioxygenase
MTNHCQDGSLPIIDLAPLFDGGASGLSTVASEIGNACRTIGFFYIRHHVVPQSLIDSVHKMARLLFALTLEEKQALSIAHSMNNRGYAAIGSETLQPGKLADAKEAFNLGREADPQESVDASAPLQGDNLWPAIPGFRQATSSYYAAMRRLCERLHEAIAVDLRLPRDYFARFVDRPMATLRMLRYPPHPGVFDGSRYGAGTHTDYGNLTILWQDEVGGLEVRTRDHRWIAATPVPGTFVCNIGDCLMRWSNDIYVSTPHRVVNASDRERHSIVFFFDPNPDALVDCLPTCRALDGTARYPPVTAAEYLRERLDATYSHRNRHA